MTDYALVASPFTATGQHGEALTFAELTEVVTVASGVQEQQTALVIPAGAVVLAVTSRVLVQPGGTATMSVRGAGSAHQFNGDDVTTTAGSTDRGTNGCPFYAGASEAIVYVFDVPTTNGSGSIRCAVLYYVVTPPTA